MGCRGKVKKKEGKKRKNVGLRAINEMMMIEAAGLLPHVAALDEFPKHGTEQDSTRTRTQ